MKTLSRIYNGLVFAFLYAPIVVLIIFSFNDSKSRVVWNGFSLRWYEELFGNEEILSALGVTLSIALITTVVATIIGTAAAIGIRSVNSKLRKVLLAFNNLPMVNPEIVTGIALMLLFVFVGRMIGAAQSLSFWTLLIAHITFNLPYVILNVLPKLRQTDKYLSSSSLLQTPVI